jgi:hypothetical protein
MKLNYVQAGQIKYNKKTLMSIDRRLFFKLPYKLSTFSSFTSKLIKIDLAVSGILSVDILIEKYSGYNLLKI